MGALLLAVLWVPSDQVLAQTSKPEPSIPAVRVDIAITARQFRPSPVSVPVGQRVVLVFNNQDAELHAFVPKQFLEGAPHQVEGNGAAQFGDKGLLRVLIPSGGRAEVHFVPTTVGEFEYRCDLPGHQMVGKLVVEDGMANQRAAARQDVTDQTEPSP